MRTDKKQLKQQAIEQAAYDLIEKKGFLGMSMLSIAKRARASNETLYNWYGDKNGLFSALIKSNAAETKALLKNALSAERSPMDALEELGPVLLNLLLGTRAIALNRAAAADPSGELGKLLSQFGKETVFPLIIDLFHRFPNVKSEDAPKVAQDYLGLLVGDLQIRRAIGAIQQPSKKEIKLRASNATQAVCQLHQINK